jgi:hypothetical protein
MSDKVWRAISTPAVFAKEADRGLGRKPGSIRFLFSLVPHSLPFLKEETMSRFIVVHGAPPEIAQDQVVDGAKSVVASLPEDTDWLNSWAAGPAGKLICEWEAPDAERIRAALEPIIDLFPIESIYEVEWIDPEWYE